LKAVILAGGLGKRLRPITEEMPKPLIPVLGRPIIEWQIEWFKEYGVREFVVCAGYLKEKIVETLGNGSRLGVKIGYVVEEEPLGTGGAIKNAEVFLRSESGFFVVNGDVITDLDPTELILEEGDPSVIASIALVPLPSPYGIIDVDGEGNILAFREKPVLEDYWINAGVYFFRPAIFEYLPEIGDIEKTAFPELAKSRKLRGIKYRGVLWKSIDTHKDLEETEKLLEGKLGRYAPRI